MRKSTSKIKDVPELIDKLKELHRYGGLIMGTYTMRIHKSSLGNLIEDLESTNNAASMYWKIREGL